MDHTATAAHSPDQPLWLRALTWSHPCPVCGIDVPKRYGPGRARIYCTNACRQRAYAGGVPEACDSASNELVRPND